MTYCDKSVLAEKCGNKKCKACLMPDRESLYEKNVKEVNALYDKLRDEIEAKRASILGTLKDAYSRHGMPTAGDKRCADILNNGFTVSYATEELCHCSGRMEKEFCVVHSSECSLKKL